VTSSHLTLRWSNYRRERERVRETRWSTCIPVILLATIDQMIPKFMSVTAAMVENTSGARLPNAKIVIPCHWSHQSHVHRSDQMRTRSRQQEEEVSHMEGGSERELWSVDDDDVQRHRATDAAGRPTQRAPDKSMTRHMCPARRTAPPTASPASINRERARERMDERERHRVIDVDDRELDINQSS